MSETPLREIKNCGECPFATCPDEGYATIRCTLFAGDNATWVLRSACCAECRHSSHRDNLRRRVLEFEAQPQLLASKMTEREVLQTTVRLARQLTPQNKEFIKELEALLACYLEPKIAGTD